MNNEIVVLKNNNNNCCMNLDSNVWDIPFLQYYYSIVIIF